MKGSPSRGEGRKAVIAEVALRVFLERGFSATVDDVAAEANASKQTIYKFFGDRDGLLRAALGLELERVVGPMRSAAERDGDPHERLAEFAEAYQDVLFSPECVAMYRFVIGAADAAPEMGTAFDEMVVSYVLDLLRPMIAEATGASAEVAATAADAFVGTLQGSELNRALAGLPVDRDRLAALRSRALAGVRLSEAASGT